MLINSETIFNPFKSLWRELKTREKREKHASRCRQGGRKRDRERKEGSNVRKSKQRGMKGSEKREKIKKNKRQGRRMTSI